MKAKIDEFAFILLAGLAFIIIFAFFSQTFVSDIEVEPASLNAKLVEGSVKTFLFTIYANASNINISLQGPVATYSKLDVTSLDVFGKEEIKMFFDARATGTFSGNLVVETPYRKVTVPIKIEVISEDDVAELLRVDVINIPDFEISAENTTAVLAEKENLSLKTTLFESNYETLSFDVPQDVNKSEITLELEVASHNNVAPLIVELNGERIFADAIRGIVQISLPEELIRNSNSIKVYADIPPAPWQVNEYNVSYVKVLAKRDISSSFRYEFELSDKQVNNFVSMKLEFLAKENTVNELFVTVNNQLLYARRPPRVAFSYNFTDDLFGNPIFVKDRNEIIISIEEQGKLSATNVNLFIYYLD